MRLELGQREAVVEQGLGLIQEIERQALGLTAGGNPEVALKAMLAATQTMRLAATSVHDFTEISFTLSELEMLLGELLENGANRAALDSLTGGLLLHVVSGVRHALAGLGGDSRAARLIPKMLQDLRRAMSAMRQRQATARAALARAQTTAPVTPAPVEPTEPPEAAPAEVAREMADEYVGMFLRDDSNYFGQLAEMARQLSLDPHNRPALDEAFRLVHTIKGNAMALGLKGLSDYAAASEDLLGAWREGKVLAGAEAAGQVVTCAETLRRILEDYRRGEARVQIDDRVAEVRAGLAEARALPEAARPRQAAPAERRAAEPQSLFLLSVRIGGRELLVPCGGVAQVVRKPQLLALPGGREGWLGLIRYQAALIPLIDPGSILGAEHAAGPTELALVLGGEAGEKGETLRLAVPVDEVGGVVEVPYGINAGPPSKVIGTVLDIPSLLNRNLVT